MEKYGFIYIWYDVKHKRYYIGCHWGFDDDGYICSSSWMKNSYKRRPLDFKRKILEYVYSNRKEMFLIERKWLNMIKEEELGIKYYNLTITHPNHWSSDAQSHSDTVNKLKNIWTPEMRMKASLQKLGDKNPMKRSEVSQKVAKKNKGREAWNKGVARTEEQKQYHSKKMKGREAWNKGVARTEDYKRSVSSVWEITLPNGNVEIIRNLSQYCKDNNLSQPNMHATSTRDIKYKGYRVKKIKDGKNGKRRISHEL